MRRVFGFLIDQLIFGTIFLIILSRSGITTAAGFGNPTYDRSVLILFGMELVYPVALIALLGQTLGCMAARIRIVRAGDGALPGWGHAVRRVAVANLPGLVPVLGLLFTVVCYGWIFRDPCRQGLHDKAAGTVVIDARRA